MEDSCHRDTIVQVPLQNDKVFIICSYIHIQIDFTDPERVKSAQFFVNYSQDFGTGTEIVWLKCRPVGYNRVTQLSQKSATCVLSSCLVFQLSVMKNVYPGTW